MERIEILSTLHCKVRVYRISGLMRLVGQRALRDDEEDLATSLYEMECSLELN